ncbi:MAG: hypothetical protein SYR96_10135 [Actinomycetota bacterium]|nr:hypothetical protein [Actinomycetota bacterium]
MANGTRSSARRPGGGPGRLPTHRLVLAMALISTGPPLVIHEGWRGLPVAVAAVLYAAYLLLGKRWPRLRRRRVSPARPARLPTTNSATSASAPTATSASAPTATPAAPGSAALDTPAAARTEAPRSEPAPARAESVIGEVQPKRVEQ